MRCWGLLHGLEGSVVNFRGNSPRSGNLFSFCPFSRVFKFPGNLLVLTHHILRPINSLTTQGFSGNSINSGCICFWVLRIYYPEPATVLFSLGFIIYFSPCGGVLSLISQFLCSLDFCFQFHQFSKVKVLMNSMNECELKKFLILLQWHDDDWKLFKNWKINHVCLLLSSISHDIILW
jgi:hypothetical protein